MQLQALLPTFSNSYYVINQLEVSSLLWNIAHQYHITPR